ECAWEDVADAEHTIRHEDRYKEYERVDRLMKLGILKNVDYRLIENVKNMPYDKEKWIYKQSDDRTCRYILGTKGTKTLICCGVNPSTASPEDLDPTMKNVEAIARANGYDSYVMINLYPMRATDPNDMHKFRDESIIEENLKHIKDILAVGNCDIWAAWGTLIETRGYLRECLEKLLEITKSYNCNWYTIGKRSKDNHPHHPLYLNKDSKMVEFEDIEDYASMLKTRK
ncbi:MAG: DUF1643 domain-containing protein, partial [Parabacteroides sp.]|nr:DUF1643 domain-containing protein [Parabacteroides sp.]